MLSQFRELNPDRIVFTGDLVQSKNQISPEMVRFVTWLLTECSDIAKTIIMPGNHDALINNLTRLDALTPIIQAMNNPNVSYYRDMGVYEDENVSWCVYSQFQGNMPPDIYYAEGEYKIGLFHGLVQGLKTDQNFKINNSGHDVSVFEGLDFVLCGDVHRRSTFDIPNGKKGVMIGSCIQQNNGESVHGHGFGVLTLDDMNYEFFDLDNPRPYLSFKITSYDDILNEVEKLVNG
jgi:DNA repair exonuclease SbcCD nuclease subunit